MEIFGYKVLWRFWNCFSDDGRQELLESIDMMKSSPWLSKKTLYLVNPLTLNQQWIEITGRFKVLKNMILNYRNELEILLEINESSSSLEIKLGKESMNEFEDLVRNGFDCGIETDELTIMFW